MPTKMRERFASFQRKTIADLDQLWSTAEFTFDANVLLNLYRSPRIVIDGFAKHLSKLGARFYLTDQVVLEFYRNREKVINQAIKTVEVLDEMIGSLPAAFSANAQRDLGKLLAAERTNLEAFLSGGDTVEKCISDAVQDRIDPPSADITSLYTEIDKRYLAQIPPGFADVKEKDDYKKYGDAVLWLQAVSHHKRSKKPLILVTSDDKYDWWLKDHENKTLGPRPELAHELWEKAGVHFHLYSFKQFLTFAAKQWPDANASDVGGDVIEAVEKMEDERSVEQAERRRIAEVAKSILSIPVTQDSSLEKSLQKINESSRSWHSVAEQLKMMQDSTRLPQSTYEQLMRMHEPTRISPSALEQLRQMQDITRIPESTLQQLRRMEETFITSETALEQLKLMQEPSRLANSLAEQLRRQEEMATKFSSEMGSLKKLNDSIEAYTRFAKITVSKNPKKVIPKKP